MSKQPGAFLCSAHVCGGSFRLHRLPSTVRDVCGGGTDEPATLNLTFARERERKCLRPTSLFAVSLRLFPTPAFISSPLVPSSLPPPARYSLALSPTLGLIFHHLYHNNISSFPFDFFFPGYLISGLPSNQSHKIPSHHSHISSPHLSLFIPPHFHLVPLLPSAPLICPSVRPPATTPLYCHPVSRCPGHCLLSLLS